MARPIGDRTIKIKEILLAADELFITKGYKGTTITDIAQKIGMAQGALYYYFKSKEELLKKLLERHAEELLAEINLIAKTDEAAAAKISNSLSIIIQKAGYKNGILLNLLYDQDNWRIKEQIFNELGLTLRPILTEIINYGIKNGEFSTCQQDVVVDYILVITDYLSTVIYNEKMGAEFQHRVGMAETIIETILGAHSQSIKING